MAIFSYKPYTSLKGTTETGNKILITPIYSRIFSTKSKTYMPSPCQLILNISICYTKLKNQSQSQIYQYASSNCPNKFFMSQYIVYMIQLRNRSIKLLKFETINENTKLQTLISLRPCQSSLKNIR